jgi:hypothetical protein
MPANQQTKNEHEHEKQQRQQMSAAIGRQVLEILGQPGDMCRVQVRRLWDDHYRVNIFRGADVVSARILHSFFLRTDDDGKILSSTPKIKKTY